MPTDRGPLLIVGASTRAAAESAASAGFEVYAIDRFGDTDLRDVAWATVIGNWDDDAKVLDAAAMMPAAPWLYTGAMENRPALIETLSSTRPLLGCPPEVALAVREPIQLADRLRKAGFRVPNARRDSTGLPRDGSWLQKPLASGGGLGIQRLVPGIAEDGRTWFQEWIGGRGASAVWLAGPNRSILVGVTRQVSEWTASGCEYTSSIGPITAPVEDREKLERLGEFLRIEFGLIGLYGADFIRRGREWYLVEVNPRPTASVEIHEWAHGRSLIEAQVRCCQGEAPDAPRSPPSIFAAKHVVRSPVLIDIPPNPDWTLTTDNLSPGLDRTVVQSILDRLQPRVSDRPQPGSMLAPGDPIVTLGLRARSLRDLHRNAAVPLAMLHDRLLGWAS